ncbi:MAG: D-isomer specific 2-hydroxyacid dehydrogenase family protein [Breznakia sp.]
MEQQNYRIVVINSSSFAKHYPSHLRRLENIGPVTFLSVDGDMRGKALAKRVQDYNIIIASVTPFFDQEFFAYKQDVLLISRHGIGYNNIDLEAAKKTNTKVSIVSPLVERDAVAENAIANLFAIMRQLPEAKKAAQENRWSDRAQFLGNNLSGKTVGIIGCGNIGTRTAEIMKYGFHCHVLICDPAIDKKWMKKHDMKLTSLDDLLAASDIISLHASLNETSKNILSKEAFQKMKRGVYICNTARGALVDETAMCQALDEKIVKGFASDVMIQEPANNKHPYFAYDNVLITPHTSAYSDECLEGMGNKCVEDVENLVEDGEIICRVA